MTQAIKKKIKLDKGRNSPQSAGLTRNIDFFYFSVKAAILTACWSVFKKSAFITVCWIRSEIRYRVQAYSRLPLLPTLLIFLSQGSFWTVFCGI